MLADGVDGIWRTSGSEDRLLQLFERAAASGRSYTTVELEWRGLGSPHFSGVSAHRGASDTALAVHRVLRKGDQWQRVSDRYWTLQLDGRQASALAPLLRLASYTRALEIGRTDDASAAIVAGHWIAHLPGASYRLPEHTGRSDIS